MFVFVIVKMSDAYEVVDLDKRIHLEPGRWMFHIVNPEDPWKEAMSETSSTYGYFHVPQNEKRYIEFIRSTPLLPVGSSCEDKDDASDSTSKKPQSAEGKVSLVGECAMGLFNYWVIHDFTIPKELEKIILEKSSYETFSELSLWQFCRPIYKQKYWQSKYLEHKRCISEYPRALCLLFLQRLNEKLDEEFFRKYPVSELRHLVVKTWNYDGCTHFPKRLEELDLTDQTEYEFAYIFVNNFYSSIESGPSERDYKVKVDEIRTALQDIEQKFIIEYCDNQFGPPLDYMDAVEASYAEKYLE